MYIILNQSSVCIFLLIICLKPTCCTCKCQQAGKDLKPSTFQGKTLLKRGRGGGKGFLAFQFLSSLVSCTFQGVRLPSLIYACAIVIHVMENLGRGIIFLLSRRCAFQEL